METHEPEAGFVPKKIAVVGSGISGLVAAHLLSRSHHVTVFEAEAQIGGHTATKTVTVSGQDYAIDTGFIVFNDRTYPNFIKLLSRLGVESQQTAMGFSVASQAHNFEYSGTSFNGLFAQRRNLLSLRYWRMLKDIVRFNKACTQLHETDSIPPHLSLGEYLVQENYSEFFRDFYILPMVSAIWSSGIETSAAMPLTFFIRFFHNHGLLTVTQQPQWFTVKGGSQSYLKPLTQNFKEHIHTNTPVQWVKRHEHGVTVFTAAMGEQGFDEVIFACHSDQALKLLADPSPQEYDILSAIPYKMNDVSLHLDSDVLPRSRRAWASWNYLMLKQSELHTGDEAVLTYNMNILQNIQAPVTFCVSVNATAAIKPEKLLGQYRYAHPMFTRESVAAQARWLEISGLQHTHFCGAYWRNGFHEDGVVSGIKVAAMLGEEF